MNDSTLQSNSIVADQNVAVVENDLGLDLTLENSSSNKRFANAAGDYDPRPHEDTARRRIAYALIALLFATVITIFWMLHSGQIETDELKEFAVILGPIITLVSAATGFYYGTKSH